MHAEDFSSTTQGTDQDVLKTPDTSLPDFQSLRTLIAGVAPSDMPLYASDTFQCNVSKTNVISLPIHHLNDDYCDCIDGRDSFRSCVVVVD